MGKAKAPKKNTKSSLKPDISTPSAAENHGGGTASSLLERFMNEQQDPEIVKVVHQKVSEILTTGEEILYIAVQSKPLVNVSPDSVILTNRRFIIYRPQIFGRVTFEDYIWRDLRDARLREGLMGLL